MSSEVTFKVGDKVAFRDPKYLWSIDAILPDGRVLLSRQRGARKDDRMRVSASVLDVDLIEPAIEGAREL